MWYFIWGWIAGFIGAIMAVCAYGRRVEERMIRDLLRKQEEADEEAET